MNSRQRRIRRRALARQGFVTNYANTVTLPPAIWLGGSDIQQDLEEAARRWRLLRVAGESL